VHLVDTPAHYPPHTGGLEQYAKELHRRLLDHDPNLRITVLTSAVGTKPGVERLSDRWTVVRWPAWEPVAPLAIPHPRLLRLLRESCLGPDADPQTVLMTHTRFFIHGSVIGWFAKRHRLRWVHVEHGSSPVQSGGIFVRVVASIVDTVIGRPMLRSADAVAAVSRSCADFVKKLSGRTASVLYRGMELPDGLVSDNSGEPPTACFVGRLLTGKGVADLLDATALMHRNGIPLRLRLCGDGVAHADLVAQAKRLGLIEHVDFLGTVDNQTALAEMSRATVFVNPSWSEGLPTTVLEAAAMGAPVVATDVGGTTEIVTDGVTGWIVPPHDPNRLAEALTAVCRNPDLRAATGAKLREATLAKFSWANTVANFEALATGER
jgi:glycosyltransferase involved in cell wall biosynthesis